MSKNKNDYNLLIPGESGWDIWSCTSSESALIRKTEESQALNIDKFPTNKPLIMAFPVRELTALELWTPQDEEETISDLISFQVEKMGLAQGEENGVLHQHSLVSRSEENSQELYLIDVLRAPREGTLPSKSPKRFSISPRCFHFESDAVTLWKEFGKWVLGISDPEGNIVHYQSFTETRLGVNTLEDIRFTIGQLLIQNVIKKSPENYIVWTEEEGIYPEGFDTLEKVFNKKIRVEPKPSPILPPAGELLPADTRAERLESKRKKRQNILLTLASMLLLGLLAFAGYKLWDLEKKATMAKAKATSLTEENQSLLDHQTKWDELSPLVDTENAPVSLLIKATKSLPSNNIRLKRAEFTHQITETEAGKELSIILIGEANDFAQASKYDENLTKSKDLAHFTWNNQDPAQSKTGWSFTFRGEGQ